MQIYNIETKAIISGEEIKELDDCFILSKCARRRTFLAGASPESAR